MPKKYNIGKKSDMRKFERDIKKKAYDIVDDSVKKMEIDIKCPHCGRNIKAKSGNNVCPHCKSNVELNINR